MQSQRTAPDTLDFSALGWRAGSLTNKLVNVRLRHEADISQGKSPGRPPEPG
jgi:hypothetical protein